MTANIDCNNSSECKKPCPNEVYEYKFYTNRAGYTITCDEWEVTGGVITQGGEANDNTCKVRWNDEEEGILLIPRITATSGDYSSYVENISFTVEIHSLNGAKSPGISGTWEVEYSSTTPITYTAQPIKDHAGQEVSEYLWKIPVGWSVDGVVSTVLFRNFLDLFEVFQNSTTNYQAVIEKMSFFAAMRSLAHIPQTLNRKYSYRKIALAILAFSVVVI